MWCFWWDPHASRSAQVNYPLFRYVIRETFKQLLWITIWSLSCLVMNSVVRAEAVTHLWAAFLLISGPKSQVRKDNMLCDASWRGCSVTINESGVLSSYLGLGWNFPKCRPRELHPVLLVLGQPVQALFGLQNDLSRVCRLWAGHCCINKSLLEQSYVHLFMDCLWLLFSRVE